MAFPDGWSHRWPIAINADSVISSPVADWPCLITDAHVPAGAWAQMQATGADLRFSLDEAGATELYYDAPRLSVAGESAHLYVAVPSLASGADTTIWAWVGNAEATAPSAAWMQQTYPASIAAWWPMEEGAGTTVGDRTGNGYDGSLSAGASWDGYTVAVPGAEYIGIATPPAPGLGDWSFLWRSYASTTTSFNVYVDARTSPSGWGIHTSTANKLAIRYTFLSTVEITGITDAQPTGVWMSGGVVVDRDDVASFYQDGSSVGSPVSTAAFAAIDIPSVAMRIGGQHEGYVPQSFNGFYDCAAYFSRTVSADENALFHAMLSAPATFAAAGELVAVGGSIIRPRGPRTLRMGPRTILSGVI